MALTGSLWPNSVTPRNRSERTFASEGQRPRVACQHHDVAACQIRLPERRHIAEWGQCRCLSWPHAADGVGNAASTRLDRSRRTCAADATDYPARRTRREDGSRRKPRRRRGRRRTRSVAKAAATLGRAATTTRVGIGPASGWRTGAPTHWRRRRLSRSSRASYGSRRCPRRARRRRRRLRSRTLTCRGTRPACWTSSTSRRRWAGAES